MGEGMEPRDALRDEDGQAMVGANGEYVRIDGTVAQPFDAGDPSVMRDDRGQPMVGPQGEVLLIDGSTRHPAGAADRGVMRDDSGRQMVNPDGSVLLIDGSTRAADGTVYEPDGTRVGRDKKRTSVGGQVLETGAEVGKALLNPFTDLF